MGILAHAGGWWELLIPVVIGFGIVLTLRLSRRGSEERDEKPRLRGR